MSILHVNADNFDVVKQSEKPVLLDFYADWCGPCRMLAPVVEQIAAEHPEMVVGKVNVDEEGALAAQFGISSIPFVALLRDGKVVATSLGYRTKEALLEALGI